MSYLHCAWKYLMRFWSRSTPFLILISFTLRRYCKQIEHRRVRPGSALKSVYAPSHTGPMDVSSHVESSKQKICTWNMYSSRPILCFLLFAPLKLLIPSSLCHTSHICSWKNRLSFSISSAISAPLISVLIIPCCLACSFFSFSILVLAGNDIIGVKKRNCTAMTCTHTHIEVVILCKNQP